MLYKQRIHVSSSSTRLWQPTCVAAVPATRRHRCTAAHASGDGEWPGERDQLGNSSSGGSSHNRPAGGGGGQQNDSSSSSSWGSNWARRPSSNQPRKPVSFFGKSSSFEEQQGGAESSGSRGARGSSSNSGGAMKPDPQLEASIRQNVDRAAETLQEIITEVLNELLIDEASAYVLDEEGPGLQLNQAARNAVVKRLEWLDSNFLAALNAYLAAPSVQRNSELTTLLGAVRQEVLDLVAARLPPSVQVLNTALSYTSRRQRSEVVALALSGGGGALPGAPLDALGAAALQLVDDMEDQQVIADRALLARLVLMREELRTLAEQQAAEQQGWGSSGAGSSSSNTAIGEGGAEGQDVVGDAGGRFFAFHRSNLPARCAAFMKELLAVPERDRRLGLMSKAFQEDWMGESPGPNQTPSSPPAGARPMDTSYSHQSKPESLDIVRPGRFFSTLHAMRAELEQQFASTGLEAGAPSLTLLRQLETIRMEALVALDHIQRCNATSARAPTGFGSSNDIEPFDYELDVIQ